MQLFNDLDCLPFLDFPVAFSYELKMCLMVFAKKVVLLLEFESKIVYNVYVIKDFILFVKLLNSLGWFCNFFDSLGKKINYN